MKYILLLLSLSILTTTQAWAQLTFTDSGANAYSFSNPTLTRDSGSTGFTIDNSGTYSDQTNASAGSSASFTNQSGSDLIYGLMDAAETNVKLATIDYGWYNSAPSTSRPRINGALPAGCPSNAGLVGPSDVFEIEIDGNDVVFIRNTVEVCRVDQTGLIPANLKVGASFNANSDSVDITASWVNAPNTFTYSSNGAGTFQASADVLTKLTTDLSWDLSVRTVEELSACPFQLEVDVKSVFGGGFVGDMAFGLGTGTNVAGTAAGPEFGVYRRGADGAHFRTDASNFSNSFDTSIPTSAAGDKFKWSCSGSNIILEVDQGSGYSQFHDYGAASFPLYFEWKPYSLSNTEVGILSYTEDPLGLLTFTDSGANVYSYSAPTITRDSGGGSYTTANSGTYSDTTFPTSSGVVAEFDYTTCSNCSMGLIDSTVNDVSVGSNLYHWSVSGALARIRKNSSSIAGCPDFIGTRAGALKVEIETGGDVVWYDNSVEVCRLTGETLPTEVKLGFAFNANGDAADILAYEAGAAPVPGVCGSANGGSFATEPTTNLCASGTPSAVTDNGSTWDWTCTDGSATACSATNTAGPGPGDFTGFNPPNPRANSINSKGGLLTSDGSQQVEVPACADGQVLIYNSGQASGLECGAN